MFGVPGLDPLGLVHTLFALAALVCGALVVRGRKGARRHRLLGRAYVLNMVLLNATALMIYDLTGRFGPFHVAALASLATVGAGFLPAYARRPKGRWVERHAAFMAWSFVGLVAAFVAEVVTRIPGIRFGPSAIAATLITIAAGAIVMHRALPRALTRFRMPARSLER